MSPRAGFLILSITVVFGLDACRFAAVRADDVQVNSYTTGRQHNVAAAIDADGDFVVVWESTGSPGTDSDGTSIQGRRFNSDGGAVGAQFQINLSTASNQSEPSVGMDADGGFVVVWQDAEPRISARRYDSAGVALGGEIQISTATAFDQLDPFIAVSPDGDFVVVWESRGSSGTDTSEYGVQGRLFNSDGSGVGEDFQVNTYTTSDQIDPSVAMIPNGDFIVAWRSGDLFSPGPDGSSTAIRGRRYASGGSPSGDEFQVNTYTTSSQRLPSVAADAAGNFTIVWMSFFSAGGTEIQAQRFTSGGAAVGDEFQVNIHTTSVQQDPSTAMDADGDFVVVWQSSSSGGADNGSESVQRRRFDSNGSPIGEDFQVNTYITGNQEKPVVVMNAGGDFVVAWESERSGGTDTDNQSIQKSDLEIAPFAFFDGFESGDLSAWSNATGARPSI